MKEQFAQDLEQARVNKAPISYLSEREKFGLDEAYAIQEQGLKLRLDSGETQVGYKMGLTSEAKRKQMDLHSPCFGYLLESMNLKESFSLAQAIHPKIEPEVAFLIKDEIKGDIGREEVLEKIEGVCTALEVLDTRYEAFKYFSLEDVVADNASSCAFVLGPWKKDFKDLDLANLHLNFSINGELAHEGTTQSISGDPLLSVVQLAQLLKGKSIPAGSIVLAGAATPAVSLEPNMDVYLNIAGLEAVSVKVIE